MPTLHIHLRDGFTGEPVRVRLGGHTVYDRPDVRTRMQTGLADLFEVPLPDGAPPGGPEVTVELPGRGRTEVVRAAAPDAGADAAGDLHLALSLAPDGALTHAVSRAGFFYA